MALKPRALLAAIVAATLALPGAAAAEDMVERARQIREQLLTKKRETDEHERRSTLLERMVAESRQRLAKVDAEIQAAEDRRAKAAAAGEQAVTRLAELDGVVGREKAVHRTRVAAIYRAARIGAGAAGWTGATTENVRLSRYLVATAGAGARKIARIEIERGSFLAALDRARGEQETASAAVTSLQSERFAVESEVARAEAEAQTFASQAKTAAATAAELEASARTLERELAAMPKPAAAPKGEPVVVASAPETGGQDAPATATPVAPRATQVPPVSAGASVPGSASPSLSASGAAPAGAVASAAASPERAAPPRGAPQAAPAGTETAKVEAATGSTEKKPGLFSRLFRGGNADAERFAAHKGALPAPVPGKVVANYGQQHKSGNKYRGVIVRSKGGASVRSVAEGQVIFAGQLSGMGNTVIVSHGGRYHSVYARLGAVKFKEGDRIGAGDVVGTMPPDDPDLHFELRDGGQAVDPLPWVSGGAGAFGQ